MHQYQLDLVGSEEAAGARVLAVAELHRIDAGGDELVLVLVPWLLAQLLEAEAIELVRRLPEVGIAIDLRVGRADVGAAREDGAVGEGEVGRDLAVEGDLAEGIRALGFLDEAIELLELWHAGLA